MGGRRGQEYTTIWAEGTKASVQTSVWAALLFGHSRCLGEKGRNWDPGMADTFGCLHENSAQL